MEKTTIKLVGNIGPISQEIRDLGFKFVEEFTLLGAKISNNIEELGSCFQTTLEKINNVLDFWSRLRLTLPGRIAVAKIFMLSLTIDDFCIGPLKVAKNRRYEPPSAGGLGLINLRDFVSALQCTWVKRVHSHGVDTWRYDMLQLCFGNPFLLNTTLVKRNINPIIYNIAQSFERLSKTYYGTGKNYLKAYIYCNPLFVRGKGDNGILCRNFFGNGTPVNLLKKIAKLKLEDLLMRGGLKSLAQINTEFEVDFTLNTYMRLSEALTYFLEKKRIFLPQSL